MAKAEPEGDNRTILIFPEERGRLKANCPDEPESYESVGIISIVSVGQIAAHAPHPVHLSAFVSGII